MSDAARRWIEALGMTPHPEGGWYVQTHRPPGPGRPPVTAIYYLLRAKERSHWHRIDATETWCFHAGSPLLLRTWAGPEHEIEEHLLGLDLDAGARPQATVGPGVWMAARTLGSFSLLGCTVAPGFQFEGFELAPEDWEPPTAQ